MSGNRTAGSSLATAAEWFAGGQRIPYDPESARVVTEEEVAATPGGLRVFERVAAATQDEDDDTVWLTLLPGFPDGSYGWARVDRMFGDALGPRLYVEPVGQGDSDKPRDYRYSTVERADLVEALWRHHGVRRTVVVAFDYTAMALLELLRRQLDRTTATPAITADAHGERWPVRRRADAPVVDHPGAAYTAGRTVDAGAQRSPRVFDATILRARLYSRSYRPAPDELAELRLAITRRDGAAFLHNAAGFVSEHRRLAQRWDLAAIARNLDGTVALYVGGSDEDAYEHRQFQATRERVPQAEMLTFPGGHLTTSEHPDLLAAANRDIAECHGVGTPAPG
jgi:pimeloyl-ACP methyl ester carboxylesterase